MHAGYLLLIGRWTDEPFSEYRSYVFELLIDLVCNSGDQADIFDEGLDFIKRILIDCSEFSFRKKVAPNCSVHL